MFEISEMLNFRKQINENLTGKRIISGSLGNSPHKFVWYNRSHEEFAELVKGTVIKGARIKGRWLMIDLHPELVLLFGECGGKILLHKPGEKIPAKYHLLVNFEDGSFLSATTQMWGAYELFNKGDELNRQYLKDTNPIPLDDDFTYEYFSQLITEINKEGKRSVKSLLTQEQTIPGLGNAVAQDIMFNAGLNPRFPLHELSQEQISKLYDSIIDTVREIFSKGGRNDEYDLFGNKGNYIRLMDKNAAGKPCPVCGDEVKKISYLGGTCYLCPTCQPEIYKK